MNRARPIAVILSLSLMLTLTQCRQEAPPAQPQDEKPAAAEPAPAVSVAEMEALQDRVNELESQVARLDQARARINGLEEQLGYVKSGLNNLEKRPIPAPADDESQDVEDKEEVAREEMPEPKVKDDQEEPPPAEEVEVAEPVPTAPADEAGADNADTADIVSDVEETAIPVGDVALVNMKFATKVDRDTRSPVKESTVFSRNENRLYCWLVLSNMAEEETQVKLYWKREGEVVSDISLRVGKHTSHWRTWAYIRPHTVGQWEVELQDMSGKVIGTGTFTVE